MRQTEEMKKDEGQEKSKVTEGEKDYYKKLKNKDKGRGRGRRDEEKKYKVKINDTSLKSPCLGLKEIQGLVYRQNDCKCKYSKHTHTHTFIRFFIFDRYI
jgi:hypothetical protein